jgi:AraC-like DNA-binding protein
MVAAAKRLTPIIAGVEAIARGVSPLEIEEAAARFAETVLGTLSGHNKSRTSVSARDERRIADVLRYIEEHAAEPLELAALANVSTLSKYHFLRTFQRIVGTPPYQFLLTVRMRRAALRLATSSDTVSSIAFDTGFGDLSTFNNRFRDLFGMSPSAYRRRPFSR